MKRYLHVAIMLVTLLLAVQPCYAARVRAYVNRFSVSVTENRDELKQSLQTLLMSRLNSDEIQAVEKQADADIQIEASYIVFGSVFSLDALIKTGAGVFIDRVFIQGDSQNELIPALSDLAHAIQRSLGKWDPALAGKVGVEKPLVTGAEKVPAGQAKKAVSPEPKRVMPAAAAAASAATPKQQVVSEPIWESHRLPEMLNGIATGRGLADKGVEVFTTGERYLRYYLKGKKLQFLDAVMVAADEQIVGVDVADLDQDGLSEVYLSVLKGGVPASQVYVLENNHLKKIAGDLPWLLRGIAFGGSEQKIYGQKMNAAGVLSGEVLELAKNGDRFTAGSPLKLPLFANLYNFNRFGAVKGKQYIAVIHPDGYLLVYSPDGQQLWKSRDKFGGSENVVCRAETGEPANAASSGCKLNRFQRLLVTKGGEIIVPRNTGNGNGKGTYAKNNVLLLSWNGNSLQEKWRSGLSQHYLADFSFNERTRELMLLEVEPKEDASGERGSRVVVRPLE